MREQAQGHRKRCRRYDEPYHAHYLTFSCFRRQPFFSGQMAGRWFLEALDAARQAEGFHLWAFVVMPEHLHMVIAPGAEYSISRILWRIKKPLAERVVGFVREHHPEFLKRMAEGRAGGRIRRHFWQPGGGYDGILRSVEDVYEKIRYFHANPVRRGLVVRPEDWEWSSYRAWTDGQQGAIQLDLESLPQAAP